jgi:ubiquinone biosynthesis protein
MHSFVQSDSSETRRRKPAAARRRGRRAPPKEPSAAPDFRAFLKLASGALDAIERLAWDARSIAHEAAKALEDGREQLHAAQLEASAYHRRFFRLQKTGWMLTQIAAAYRLFGVRAAFVSEARADALLASLHAKNAQRFYRTSVEQGGAFIKVGQLLSARMDLLPAPWVQELSKLQDAAPEVAFEHVRAAIERELERPLERLFAELDEQPLAAASIGQVHRALTHGDEVVAVKVQRPEIETLVAADLDLLELFLEAMRASLPEMDYETIVQEIRGSVRGELDYAEEAYVMQRMADFFASFEGVRVPRPFLELCSPSVLTATFMEGRKITVVLDELRARADEGDARAQAELSLLLGRLLEVYLRQILQLGLFQADPHPGNFLVTNEGELVLLDFGCSKELPRAAYLELVRTFLAGDRSRFAQQLHDLGFATRSGDPATLLVFADAMLGALSKAAASQRIEWPDREGMSRRLQELLRALEHDPVIQLPNEFVMLARVFGTLGGLFAHYRPDLDAVRHIFPVLTAALTQAPAQDRELEPEPTSSPNDS